MYVVVGAELTMHDSSVSLDMSQEELVVFTRKERDVLLADNRRRDEQLRSVELRALELKVRFAGVKKELESIREFLEEIGL